MVLLTIVVFSILFNVYIDDTTLNNELFVLVISTEVFHFSKIRRPLSLAGDLWKTLQTNRTTAHHVMETIP